MVSRRANPTHGPGNYVMRSSLPLLACNIPHQHQFQDRPGGPRPGRGGFKGARGLNGTVTRPIGSGSSRRIVGPAGSRFKGYAERTHPGRGARVRPSQPWPVPGWRVILVVRALPSAGREPGSPGQGVDCHDHWFWETGCRPGRRSQENVTVHSPSTFVFFVCNLLWYTTYQIGYRGGWRENTGLENQFRLFHQSRRP